MESDIYFLSQTALASFKSFETLHRHFSNTDHHTWDFQICYANCKLILTHMMYFYIWKSIVKMSVMPLNKNRMDTTLVTPIFQVYV